MVSWRTGITWVDDHGNRIPGDDVLQRIYTIRLGLFHFFTFYFPGGIGNICCIVDHRRDPRPGSAAGDCDADIRVQALIFFRPGQGQVDNGIRAFIVNGIGCFLGVVPTLIRRTGCQQKKRKNDGKY